MKTEYHFYLIISINIFILLLIHILTDCKDYIKVMNTGNPKFDNKPYWVCPEINNKKSRITKFNCYNKKLDSMTILDKWSITHTTHGLIIFTILLYFYKNKLTHKLIYITLLIEIFWEVFENTPFVIKRYRNSREIYKDYIGDSFANMVSDLLFTVFGIIISWNISINYKSPIQKLLFVTIFFELLTYFLIDDNIVINLYSLFIEK